MKEYIRLAHVRDAHAERHGVRALGSECATHFVRSKNSHALLRNRCWRAPRARDGWVSPRRDTWMDRLRHEQVRLLCLCRHAAAAPRHSSASETRVRVLARCSDGCRPVAACWSPTTSTRRGDSTAGVAGRSTWRLLLLWITLVTSTHSHAHPEHTGKAAGALCACV